ncbi:MAG: NYN domain-containing protein [Chloroflexi bacterium]|nr:NYN domain-containing protein [Chloroflexota bacterium]
MGTIIDLSRLRKHPTGQPFQTQEIPITTETKREKQVAVLIDFENVGFGSIQWLFDQTSDLGRIIVRRAYADWTTATSKRNQLLEFGIEPIQLFHSSSNSKNASDIRLAIDAIDLLHRSAVDIFVIVSSDTDFVPLVSRLRSEGKVVIGAGRKATTSRTLVISCDRFYYLDDDEKKPQTPRATTRTSTSTPKDALLVRALQAAMNDEGKAVGSRVLQAMQRLDPSFDYRALGHSTYRKYLEASPDVVVSRPKDTSISDVLVEFAESEEEKPKRKPPVRRRRASPSRPPSTP